MSLVRDPNNIRLAMLGMVDENGHPYSWSAIINGGYDKAEMDKCGYPVISQYLAEHKEELGIPGAKVTHIWCDKPEDARRISTASLIPNVVQSATDVIGKVDAVVIPTDRGEEHVARCKPFIEAGLPIFIDKPMSDNLPDLRQFVAWHNAGKPFMSSSCMRYAHEFTSLQNRISEIGEMRAITMSMCKSWERYGIHAMEGVYPFLPPGGWESVANTGSLNANIVHLRHKCNVDVTILDIKDMYGAFGAMNIYGTKGILSAKFADSFTAFKAQLVDFVSFLRTGKRPFEFAQTVELMKIVIAGIQSREGGGRRIMLDSLDAGVIDTIRP